MIEANGIGVLGGNIFMPLTGTWVADLDIDQPDGTGFDSGTPVSIVCDDGFTLNGTVSQYRTGSVLDAIRVRIVGGAGGLTKKATQIGYTQPGAFVADVLAALMLDSGETLSPTISATVLGTDLTAWAVESLLVSQAIITIIDNALPGKSWRILTDGTLWIGDETWPTIDLEYTNVLNNPLDGSFILGCDSPSIYPGINIDGIGHVGQVQHEITGGTVRTKVLLDIPGQDRGELGIISSIAQREMTGIDFFTLYDAKVVKQSSDLATVDILPVDPRLMPGLMRVPIRCGLPGVKVQFSAGATVRLGWDRGNPQYPYVCLWQGGETVQLINFANGTQGVSRIGDNLTPSADLIAWGAEVVAAFLANAGVSQTISDFPSSDGDLGVINQGSSIVKAG